MEAGASEPVIDPGDRDFFDSTQIFHAKTNSSFYSNLSFASLPTTQQIEQDLNNNSVTPLSSKTLGSWADESINENDIPSTNELMDSEDQNNNVNKKRPSNDSTDELDIELTPSTTKRSKTFESESHSIQYANQPSQFTNNNQRQSVKLPNFPTNNSLQNFQQGRTVLIKPTGPNAATFCNSPVAISKALKENPFKRFIPKAVRLNRNRNLLAIDLHDHDLNNINSLLQVTEFGKFQVMCTQPYSDTSVSGVIGPVEKDITAEELFELIKCNNAEILKISRLNKFKNTSSGGKEPSMNIKIDFAGKILPPKVYLGNLSFVVKRYNLPPLKCFKCQKFGHMANGCKQKKDTCNKCSGEHKMADCTSSTTKCANCKGDHAASSRDCKYNKEAVAIEKIRREGRSFEEARKLVTRGPSRANKILEERGIIRNRNEHNPNQHQESVLNQIEVAADVHASGEARDFDHNSRSYAHAVRRGADRNCDHSALIQKHMDKVMANITKKLGSFLQEVFSLRLQKENTRERKLVLLNLTKHHFGIEYEEGDFANSLEFDFNNAEISDQQEIIPEPLSQVIQTKKVNSNKNNTVSNIQNKGTNNKDKPKTTNTRNTPRLSTTKNQNVPKRH